MSIAFLITAFAVVATPGTGAVFTISAGLTRSRTASLIAALGCTVGIVPHMVAAITGLAAVVQASDLAFAVLKWAGVAYLLYLAVATWRDRSALGADAGVTAHADVTAHAGVTADSAGAAGGKGTSRDPAAAIIRRAVAINLLNPKLTVFFFAFLPQFVGASAARPWLQMTMLSLVFMAMTFVVFAAYGIFAAGMRTHVLQRPRVLDGIRRTFSLAYVALAGRLALAAR